MLLTVDVGNTQTAFGLFDGTALAASWRIATRKESTADELAVLLLGLVNGFAPPRAPVTGVIIASVVPDLDMALAETVRQHVECEPLFVGPGLKTGLPIRYDNPHDVGADRIVNAVAAQQRFGSPVVVLDFGTATTFDVVGTDGDYLGGVIAPGPGIAAEALFDRAARLHRVGIHRPERVIGRNTEQALQSGLFHGYASLVRGVVEKIHAELGTDAPVVATGGLASTFAPELEFLAAVDPQLTLEGLRILWEKNRR